MAHEEDLLVAAGRKVKAAAYHAERLRQLLDSGQASSDSPPVPVQAHFEGVIVSLIAAVDQVAQAVNSARQLGLRQTDLVQKDVRAVGPGTSRGAPVV